MGDALVPTPRREHADESVTGHVITVDPQHPVTRHLLVEPPEVGLQRGHELGSDQPIGDAAKWSELAGIDPVIDGDHDLVGHLPQQSQRRRDPRYGAVREGDDGEAGEWCGHGAGHRGYPEPPCPEAALG